MLVLASHSLAPVADLLEETAVAFVGAAAEQLDDRDEVVAAVVDQLLDLGAEVAEVDLDAGDVAAELRDAEIVVLGGGDPYHLLQRLHATGAAAVLRDRTGPVVGVSAGAVVLGPTLTPLMVTSPFTPPPGPPLQPLRLTPVLVLPHDDRTGRAVLNAGAVARFGGDLTIVPIRDDQVVVVDSPGPTGWRVVGP